MSFQTLYSQKTPLVRRYHRLTDFDSVLEVLSRASHGTMADMNAGRCVIGVRHDMDSDCENAVRMAEWEHSNGIRSTYYVLHTDWYYRHGGQLTDLVVRCLYRIAELGHEIGLHNNTVAAHLYGQGQPADILRAELEELRSRGFEVTGTAAHGDSICHQTELVNEQVFTDYAAGAPFETVSMKDVGLDYEAYHVPRRNYLSDNGGRWNPEGIQTDGGLVVLMHPLHWRVP